MLASLYCQSVLEVWRGSRSVPAACWPVCPLSSLHGFPPPRLPACLLIGQSPCACQLACLSLSCQLFVQSVYYLYSMCIFVLVHLLSVCLPDSLPLSHVCLHVDAGCLSLFDYLHFAGRLRCSLPAACRAVCLLHCLFASTERQKKVSKAMLLCYLQCNLYPISLQLDSSACVNLGNCG